MHYRPLPEFNPAPLNITSTKFINMASLAGSQAPHLWVLPQCNVAGELVLPWFYYKNWLDVTSAADLQAMGTLTFDEIVPILSANGAATYNFNYTVYAWASNVKLTGSTTKLSVQSGVSESKSEWGDQPVSKTATAVAHAARSLSNIPYIGPFAKVTDMGASAISKIAALFGYSNPPVIDNVMPMKNLPFHSLSTPNMSEPVSTLTLDPKCELTIDPKSVDLAGVDELDISYLSQKESLLTRAYWSSVSPADTYLFSSNVTPILGNTAVTTGGATTRTAYLYPPMGHIAKLFTYWRGDIIFRFKAICSKYHKGRLVVSWDPLFRVATSTDIYTTSFSQVVDLVPDLDFSVRIPYLQARQWLTINDIGVNNWSVRQAENGGLVFASSETGTGTFNNGQISVKILNELSGPADLATVSLLVFVRAADNFELSNPGNPGATTLSPIVPQGAICNETSDLIVAGKVSAPHPYADIMYMGEAVKSIRTLLRRQVLERVIPLSGLAVNVARNHQTASFRFTKWIKAPGYSTDTFTSASSAVVAATNVPYSFSNHSATTWCQKMFIGMRGSVRRSFNITTRGESANLVSSIQVVRKNESIGSNELTSFANTAPAGSYSTNVAALLNGGNSGIEGQLLTNQFTQTGVVVECPHYYPYKFVGTQLAKQYQGIGVDDTAFRHYQMNLVLNPSRDLQPNSLFIECYGGAGTDFTFFFFIGTPMIWSVVAPAPV
jgi:hypothetical protein